MDCGGRRWCWCCQLLVLVLSLVLLLSASVAAADISVVVHVFHVASALPCLPCHCQQKKNRRIAGAPLHPLSVFPNKQRKETGGVILPHIHVESSEGGYNPSPTCHVTVRERKIEGLQAHGDAHLCAHCLSSQTHRNERSNTPLPCLLPCPHCMRKMGHVEWEGCAWWCKEEVATFWSEP